MPHQERFPRGAAGGKVAGKVRVGDLIQKKRDGGELLGEEIDHLIAGYTAGSIPDYQLSALAMAIYFRGMTDRETLDLTLALANSGETVSLDGVPGITVDKHSTGGVGDSTTLVLAPLVASAGVPVAKMSGRSLGHTGGTLDKLEAIPGFQSSFTPEELAEAVRGIGLALAGQTEAIVPADRKLYALRDVTATVDSLPLIAASIMSKKLAAGAEALVLDVKTGSGAFMKGLEEAFALAEMMVQIGLGAGRETAAVITNMDQPLGAAVGNALEVEEAILTLQGRGPADLTELCLVLGGWMLFLGGKAPSPRQGGVMLERNIANGAALDKFRELIRSQHGDAGVIEDPALFPRAAAEIRVRAVGGGYIHRLDAGAIGRAAMALGAGRGTAGAPIDLAVGVTLFKKIGDPVQSGDDLARLHLNCAPTSPPARAARRLVEEAYGIGARPAAEPRLVFGFVDRTGSHHI